MISLDETRFTSLLFSLLYIHFCCLPTSCRKAAICARCALMVNSTRTILKLELGALFVNTFMPASSFFKCHSGCADAVSVSNSNKAVCRQRWATNDIWERCGIY